MFFLFRLQFRNNTLICHCRCDRIYTEAVKCAALLKVTILSRHIFLIYSVMVTVQKMMFQLKIYSVNVTKIRSFLRIWSHLLKKSLMENFIFCTVGVLAEILLIYLLFQFRSKLYIFFYLGFLSQTLRIYRTAGDYLYSSLPPPPAQ